MARTPHFFVSALVLAGCAQAPHADPIVQARCCLSLPDAALTGPPGQGQTLVLHMEADQPAAVLVVAFKDKELAPEVLPQVVTVGARQESAGNITYDSASKLYVAFLPADSSEAREAAQWVQNPQDPGLYDRIWDPLSKWLTEKNLGLVQSGPPVRQLGAVKLGALKPPNSSPPKTNGLQDLKSSSEGSGKPMNMPPPAPAQERQAFDWHTVADPVVFGQGRHGVKVYTLQLQK